MCCTCTLGEGTELIYNSWLQCVGQFQFQSTLLHYQQYEQKAPCSDALELILADTETGSEGEESFLEAVSEHKDSLETNSDLKSGFEDKLDSEFPPGGTAQAMNVQEGPDWMVFIPDEWTPLCSCSHSEGGTRACTRGCDSSSSFKVMMHQDDMMISTSVDMIYRFKWINVSCNIDLFHFLSVSFCTFCHTTITRKSRQNFLC